MNMNNGYSLEEVRELEIQSIMGGDDKEVKTSEYKKYY